MPVNASRMLIVEDEADLCDCLSSFFSGKGFHVRCAFSGEEALDELEADPPDVVLVDIMLPGISGLELLKRACARYPRARFVVVSGRGEPYLRTAARLYGACAFIPKPFDFSERTWAPVLSGSYGS